MEGHELGALGAGGGVWFVVLTVIAFIVAGESPKVTDPTADVISYDDGDRGQVLVSALLFGLAVVLLLWLRLRLQIN